MELDVSPDINAYWCYALVLALGVITGFAQVAKHLGRIEGIWYVGGTWFLLLLYSGVPLVLFWTLDLTSAINDTSLLSAVIIGVGYERILTGGSETIRAPGDVSRFWTPFLAYADNLAERARQRVFQMQARMDERVVVEVSGTAAGYDKLHDLIISRTDDLAALQKELSDIDSAAGNRGAESIREQKTRLLYDHALLLPDAHYLMRQKHAIDRWTYFWYVKGWRSRAATAGIAILIIVILAVGIHGVVRTSDPWTQYDIWRIGKHGNSASDYFRAQKRLGQRLGGTDDQATILQQLSTLMQEPSLGSEQAKLVLQVLVRGRQVAGGGEGIAPHLVAALRTPNAHNRDQTNQALAYLAPVSCVPLDAELADWNPSDGDSVVSIERQIDRWRGYWQRVGEADCDT